MHSAPWMTTRHLVPAALGTVALAALPATAAPPAVAWTDAAALSAPARAVGLAALALDADGDGVVVWNACTASYEEGECPTRFVNESRAFRGGAFEPTRRVSGGSVAQLQVSSSRGGATARWQTFATGAWRQSSSSIGQRWGAVRRSSPPAGGGAAVATNASGQAISAYLSGPLGSQSLVARYRRGAGANWGPPRRIAGPSLDPSSPLAMIDRGGRASVVWVTPIPRLSADDAGQIRASRRRGDGRYVTTTITSAGTAATRPVLASNDRGDAVVAYTACRPSMFSGIDGECATWSGVQAAVRVAGARRFQTPRAVSLRRDGDASFVSATFSPTRRAMVAWNDATGLRAATAARRGGWTRITISGAPLGGASLAANASGNGVIAWGEGNAGGGDQIIQASPFGPDGAVGPAQQLSGVALFNETPQLAVSDSGRALLVWANAATIGSPGLRYSTTALR